MNLQSDQNLLFLIKENISKIGNNIYANLDSPLNESTLPKEGEISITGWLVSKEKNIYPEISVNIDDILEVKNESFYSRPDAALAILGEHYDKQKEKCGFTIKIKVNSLNINSILRFKISTDENVFDWLEINIKSKNELLTTKETWNKLINNKLELISDQNIKTAKTANLSIINSSIGKYTKITKKDQISNINNISEKEKESLALFFNETKTEQFPCNLVKTSLEYNHIKIRDPFDQNKFCYCDTSFHFVNGRTLLIFKNQDDSELFFLVQYVSSADAFFFPKKNLMLLDWHLTEQDLIQQIEYLFKRIDSVILKLSSKSSFSGIICSHGRPYHFYYDIIPAVNFLNKEGIINNIKNIIYYTGGDFFSIKELYNTESIESIKLPHEIENSTIEYGAYYIHIGIRYESNELMNSLLALLADERIRNFSIKNKTKNALKIINDTNNCTPLIWFGITGQKRCWVEQIDGCVTLYNDLKNQFPNVGLIIDGWTSAVEKTPLDKLEEKNDNLVYEKIIKAMGGSSNIFSIIGETSQTKIAIADKIDAFITNHATGSIHVAKFAKKPGISHLHNSMKKQAHTHYKTITIPDSEILGETSDKKRVDFLNYSINPKSVSNLVSELLKTIYIN